jgi:hypothetical protein
MSTIKQKTLTVPLLDATRVGLDEDTILTVRRMDWNPFRKFVHDLCKYSGANFGAIVMAGDEAAILAAIPQIILDSFDLTEQLLTGSTTLTSSQAGKLDPVDAFNLVAAACDIHGGEDLKNSWAGLRHSATQLALAAGILRKVTTTNGEKLMPSWLSTATVPTTSTTAPSGTST